MDSGRSDIRRARDSNRREPARAAREALEVKHGWTRGATLALLLAISVVPAAADTAADKCGGAKLKAAAKYAQALFQCHASALKSGVAVDPECTNKAVGKLGTAF